LQLPFSGRGLESLVYVIRAFQKGLLENKAAPTGLFPSFRGLLIFRLKEVTTAMSCNETTFRLIESYLEALDTPRSLAVWLMFKFNEHDALLQLEINPDNYLDPDVFRRDYRATKFLSKADFLSTSVDKRAAALESFLGAELSCRKVNLDRFKTAWRKLPQFDWLHNAAYRKIESILRCFSGDEVCDSANWGPGVTLNKQIKFDTSSTNKFRFESGITRDLHDLMGPLHELAYPLWKVNFTFHVGNKIVTVPKNSKTDRTIAVEPGINLWYQKAVGTMIRKRIRKVGVDLNSQLRNQQLAQSSSLSGSLATVDFSNASDSISRATVEALLPPRWHLFMDLLRSHFGSIEGSTLRYEKFSSMGNGFTFELESLIFFAVASSVCEYLRLPQNDVSVYGDDVILPVGAFNLFREMCDIYGFTINERKSFKSGSFRESCGSHYFAGIDCKPYFLRKQIIEEHDIYLAANSIRRGSYDPISRSCDKRFFECWQFLRSLVVRPCLISEGYGDGGFIVNFDEIPRPPQKAKHGVEGHHTIALVSIPLRYHSDDLALLLARLKGRSVEIDLGNETNLRNRVKTTRKRILIRRWADLGSWF